MRVAWGEPGSWNLPPTPRAVTIGVFDGVHTGHEHVFSLLDAEAADRALETTVLTFHPHPLTVVAPEVAPRLLTTIEQRLEVFAAHDIACVAVLPFSEPIRHLTPAAFVADVLGVALSAAFVAVGEDFRFGRNRTGNVETLTEMGAGAGFETHIVPLVGGDAPVSSTRIRHLVRDGDVASAAALLGRDLELRGTVIAGDGRGSTIGIPTANLEIPDGVAVPGRGVYTVWAVVGGDTVQAVANIGVRPTFGGDREAVEVHLLTGGRDLYGEKISVRFVDRVRDEQRFAGVDELVAQIHRDIETTRALLDR